MSYYVGWWQGRREELIALANEKGPVYVYNEETLNETLFDLLSLDALDSIFYPVSANTHPKILDEVYKLGAGFKCVSTPELRTILKRFPQINPQQLLFIPDYACGEDYEYAFNRGAVVALKDLYPLKAWPEIFKNREIHICIDPYVEYVDPASYMANQDRVNPVILYPIIEPLIELLDTLGTSVTGLYALHDPGRADSIELNQIISSLAGISGLFPEVTVICLGNGIGTSKKPGMDMLDISATAVNLEQVKELYPRFRLWIEPGFSIISHAGVLLICAIQTREEDGIHYVEIESGIKTLTRQTLYGENNDIFNLSKISEEATILPHIIGPENEDAGSICCVKRLPMVEAGDIILITNAGAYRGEPAPEHYLNARRICQVRI